ncbi:MAG: hypothetical protein A2Z93_11985 [Curvibacter sp. GWA2_64_110]|nr:MAG: hypothetical protein A2Z93_11985 [Curvibacter sp. GWA2_64_110]HCY16208.1 hypothetical protein [Curvibacter sp.]
MNKEYGKLTADQFIEFIAFVPVLLSTIREMDGLIATVPDDKFLSVMPGGYGLYSHVYELPFMKHMELVIHALNRSDDIKEIASSADPEEAILEMLRKREDIHDKPHSSSFDDQAVVTLVYSLSRSIQSLAMHGRSISSFIDEVRKTGEQVPLLDAIRMDRSVMGCPTAMNVIAKAQLRGDTDFFNKLSNAMNGPSAKKWAPLEPMRYAFLMLKEMGLNNLSGAELEDLMVNRLKAYVPGAGDAQKNLMAQYRNFKNIPTI